jgi:hypothetical protein
MQLFCFRRRIPCIRRRVLVSLLDGKTAIRGVLFEQKGDWLVLKSAECIGATDAPVEMDGDVVIECARVLFVQVVS